MNSQDAGDVAAAGNVIGKMSRHGGPVVRDEQEGLVVTPFQHQGVGCPVRRRTRVADAPDRQTRSRRKIARGHQPGKGSSSKYRPVMTALPAAVLIPTHG